LRNGRFWLGYNLRLAAFSQTLPAFSKKQGISPRDGFASDWVVSQAVRSPGFYLGNVGDFPPRGPNAID
jgi:hypothetical protein